MYHIYYNIHAIHDVRKMGVVIAFGVFQINSPLLGKTGAGTFPHGTSSKSEASWALLLLVVLH